MSTLRVTILGSGSSAGVPRADGAWGACDPKEPRNRRTRCGLMVQLWAGDAAGAADEATCVLVDTAPELRAQLARQPVHHIDSVLFTHDHADQTHGIDDLRAFFIVHRKRVPVFMDAPTRAILTRRFDYCFTSKAGYPAILDDVGDLTPFQHFEIEGPGGALPVEVLSQDHGFGPSLGFRFGSAAYSNDLVAMPPETLAALTGLDLWIVDALRDTPHPSHAHVEKALGWIETLKPKRAVLTNLHMDLDYQRLKARLPAGVEPAYDGWRDDLTL